MTSFVSSLSSFFNSPSTIFTMDIRRLTQPCSNDAKLTIVGRFLLCVNNGSCNGYKSVHMGDLLWCLPYGEVVPNPPHFLVGIHYLHFSIFLLGLSCIIIIVFSLVTPPLPPEHVSCLLNDFSNVFGSFFYAALQCILAFRRVI
ncbi:unnamed protein product [Hymenolepis diminuta]|uniref:Uncharacterized protein n=1 Tax=Hymenolepis diminuta TaxID=6216 RepID=A0A0R3SVY0_HYMDI|nr:unnamed protein product [Hymenolepis diminuta]